MKRLHIKRGCRQISTTSSRKHREPCVRALCFLLILGLLLYALSCLFPSAIQYSTAYRFHDEPKNSLDVVIIGNSDAYSGFSPMELWHSYGYPSYVCGEAAQTLAGATQLLQEVLTCQKPSVVILETDGIFVRTPRLMLDAVLQSMPPVLSERYWNERHFSPIRKSVSAVDSFPVAAKGQYIRTNVKKYKGKKKYLYRSKKSRQISSTAQHYLEQMTRLCRDNGITLLLVQIPSATSWTISKHNAVQTYADAHHLTFLDLDVDRKKFSFNWKTDSRDGGNHLNTDGARKVTLYLGKYLSEHFPLSDKRQDPAYAAWKTDDRAYQKEITAPPSYPNQNKT